MASFCQMFWHSNGKFPERKMKTLVTELSDSWTHEFLAGSPVAGPELDLLVADDGFVGGEGDVDASTDLESLDVLGVHHHWALTGVVRNVPRAADSLWQTSGPIWAQRGLNVHPTLRRIGIWMSKNWPKLDIFLNCQKFSIFQKNCQRQFFWKKMNFFLQFLKKCQVFGNFLTFKWQFSGG